MQPMRGTPVRRWFAPLAVIVVLAAACAGGADVTGPPGSDQDTATGETAPAESAPQPSSGEPVRTGSVGCEEGQFHFQQPDCLPATSVDLDEIISGGPPPDGIPSIDDPVYESIADASEWLEPTSPVMVIDIDGDVRAYPLAILTFHEIVNDVVNDVPVLVTYCPLCNSALVFERTIDGPDGEELLDFGTSGRLYRSNLVMYDRQHRNLWTQFEGEGIVGERFLGAQLTRVPGWLFGFEELTELHPDAQVLSRDTGFSRNYGANPYQAYDREGNDPFLFRGETDERLPAMTRLVGLGDEDAAVAVTTELLADERVVDVTVGGRDLVVLWTPGQASALDAGQVDDGRDVGQTAAFVNELDGEPLELRPGDEEGRFVDVRSGSSFDLRGRALDGPLEGRELEAVTHDDTFWFVWFAFRPETDLVTS
jgi:hypothetical protein